MQRRYYHAAVCGANTDADKYQRGGVIWARQNQADGLPRCLFLAHVWLHELRRIVTQAIFGMRSEGAVGEGMKEEAISLPKRTQKTGCEPRMKAIQAKAGVGGGGGLFKSVPGYPLTERKHIHL